MRERLRRMLWPVNFTLRASLNGTSFRVPVMHGTGARLRRDAEPWMTDTLRTLLSLAPGSGFMDVGVNLGQTLLKVKSLDRSIAYVGFEPNVFCIGLVNELIRLNRLQNCELIPVGLSDGAALVEFLATDEVDAGASIVTDLRPGRRSMRRQHVPVFALDALPSNLLPQPLEVIKIDVEGAELAVLTGMRRFLTDHRPWVVCEILHADTPAQLPALRQRNAKLRRLLDDCGYMPYRLLKSGHGRLAPGLQPVIEFDDRVWEQSTSPDLCDYIFVPLNQRTPTLQAFGATN